MSHSKPAQLELTAISEDANFSSPPSSEVEVDENSPQPRDLQNLAPMMRQYLELKKKYAEYILLFQVGDFYEFFFEDAKLASEALGIRLTSRDKNNKDAIPMCGVPIHAIEGYIPKLLARGFRCVLMSQVEDAKNKKGVVRREITRIVTPGVRYQGDGLEEKTFNYLAAACLSQHEQGALLCVDVSTGHLRIRQTDTLQALLDALETLRPAELLLPSSLYAVPVSKNERWLKTLKEKAAEINCQVLFRPFENPDRKLIAKRLQQSFSAHADQGKNQLSLSSDELSAETLSSLQVLFAYVDDVSFGHFPVLSQVAIENDSTMVFLDNATRRNLELTETRLDRERKHSLLGHIDYTKTAMGSRLLSSWILAPSRDLQEITNRLDSVEELISVFEKQNELQRILTGVRDLERIISRITSHRANPQDFRLLADSLQELPQLEALLKETSSTLLKGIANEFDALPDISKKLESAIVEQPPLKINEGGIFREGYHEEIDRLRKLSSKGREWLLELEAKERARTGISSLRVKYNNVFGYFIEITKTHLHKAPEDYERRQTLVNAERFVTPQLKEFEQSLLSSRAKHFELERELFLELRDWLSGEVRRIQQLAYQLSTIDCLCAFAAVATEKNYIRPEISEGEETIIEGGRHPVVEEIVGAHNFVANDTFFNLQKRRFLLVMGPNMGGKSTYLRQVGLIQILAQAGSFVPAQKARLGLVDRIFTRIGTADDITRGDSTFMVEMREAASIVKKATRRSLVLIDEIGRGTATRDGLAIATAIAEWLHDEIQCRTIFATHFHELTTLEKDKPGVVCLSVGILENDEKTSISFTHRIVEQVVDKSFGVEVARLAGLPEALISRAFELLSGFERNEGAVAVKPKVEKPLFAPPVNVIAQQKMAVIERIQTVNPDAMTPLQALQEISALRELLKS